MIALLSDCTSTTAEPVISYVVQRAIPHHPRTLHYGRDAQLAEKLQPCSASEPSDSILSNYWSKFRYCTTIFHISLLILPRRLKEEKYIYISLRGVRQGPPDQCPKDHEVISLFGFCTIFS